MFARVAVLLALLAPLLVSSCKSTGSTGAVRPVALRLKTTHTRTTHCGHYVERARPAQHAEHTPAPHSVNGGS